MYHSIYFIIAKKFFTKVESQISNSVCEGEIDAGKIFFNFEPNSPVPPVISIVNILMQNFWYKKMFSKVFHVKY